MTKFFDDCPCPPVPEHDCCPPFKVNLAGLEGNLNFLLFRFKCCPVIIEFDCGGGGIDTVEGILVGVGTNYVNVLQENGIVKTILTPRVCSIVWPDKDCGPSQIPCSDCPKDPCNCC